MARLGIASGGQANYHASMHRVRVKIEGLRDPAQAVQIAEMGADAIGLVFADSPRQVTAEQARAVVAALPPWVATVGVFVNASADEINTIVATTGMTNVQLHGDEAPDIVSQIDAPCIKAFRVAGEGWTDEVAAFLAGLSEAGRANLQAILLDAYDKSARGGTGKQFNWDLVTAARQAGQLTDYPPIILAGGLSPDSVADAIRAVAPWGVDVASGVESSPAVKDMVKVAAFIRNTWHV